jgi:hypothetical protein
VLIADVLAVGFVGIHVGGDCAGELEVGRVRRAVSVTVTIEEQEEGQAAREARLDFRGHGSPSRKSLQPVDPVVEVRTLFPNLVQADARRHHGSMQRLLVCRKQIGNPFRRRELRTLVDPNR